MEDSLFIAPIHNAAYLEAIARFKEELPWALLVGVFETAFHRTIPLERRLYALPYEWYEKYGLQRLGYHSASHSYIARTVAASPEGASPGRIISCHLGGSCSISAILDGKSVDNSFGFSLQTGVPHANRAGDIDPYILLYLLHEGLEMEEILEGFERKGGMMGLSGFSNDMRDLEEAASGGAGADPAGGEPPGRSERAALALDVFVTAVQRYIGQYFVELGGLDVLAFTGGIGENSPLLRGRICASVQSLGVELDGKANEEGKGDRIISSPSSKVQIRVIAANEELGVARETYKLLNNRSRSQDA
jgi:acetate kinase